MNTKQPHEFTQLEKAEIISSLKSLALAQAEFWDVLRGIELEHDGLEIETDIYLIGELAAEYNTPPSMSDVSDESVWESFEFHAEAFKTA